MTEIKINDDLETKSCPNFFFVVATRKMEKDKDCLPIIKTLSMMNLTERVNIKVFIKFENNEGLSTIYNRFISEHEDEIDSNSYVVFVHDDIWINDVLFFDKIISSSKKFKVIGACGGKAWNSYGNGETPVIWTHASRGAGMSGFMIHAADESQSQVKHDVTFEGRSIFASNYGYSPSRTLTIDGCIICFTKQAIDSGLRFDERFKFHFYDMDVCFSAFVKKLEVGTAPILVTHESLGYSVSQPQFLESQKMFFEKWFKKKDSQKS